jgi:hypothetical protein
MACEHEFVPLKEQAPAERAFLGADRFGLLGRVEFLAVIEG